MEPKQVVSHQPETETILNVSPQETGLNPADEKAQAVGQSVIDQIQQLAANPSPPVEIKAKEGAPPPSSPLPPPAALSPSPAIPLTDQQVLQKIDHIKDLAQNNSGSLSSQALLGEILKEVTQLGTGFNLIITPSLNPKLETFTVPSAPGDAYYKVGISYELMLTKDGNKIGSGDIPTIERDIYTTSKTTEGALFAANDFKKTIVELAKMSSDQSYKGRFDNFKTSGQAKLDEALKQRTFKFSYNFDEKGVPRSLLSIHGSDNNKSEIDLMVSPDSEASKYIYYHDDKGQVQRLEKASAGTLSGKAIYGSEEEALLNLRIQIDEKDPFKRLAESQNLDQQLADIKARIKRKVETLAESKALFMSKKLFSFSDTQEFKDVVTNLAYKPGAKEQTADMKKKLQLGQQLNQLGDEILDDKAPTPHKLLRDEIAKVEGDMKNSQIKFNQGLDKLKKGIGDLLTELNFLEKIKVDALAKSKDPTATEKEKLVADQLLKSITDKEIKSLKDAIADHQKTAVEIGQKLQVS